MGSIIVHQSSQEASRFRVNEVGLNSSSYQLFGWPVLTRLFCALAVRNVCFLATMTCLRRVLVTCVRTCSGGQLNICMYSGVRTYNKDTVGVSSHQLIRGLVPARWICMCAVRSVRLFTDVPANFMYCVACLGVLMTRWLVLSARSVNEHILVNGLSNEHARGRTEIGVSSSFVHPWDRSLRTRALR